MLEGIIVFLVHLLVILVEEVRIQTKQQVTVEVLVVLLVLQLEQPILVVAVEDIMVQAEMVLLEALE